MKKEKLQKTAIISYITAIVLFLLLFIYMGVFEHISINKARPDPTCQVLEEYSVKEIEDSYRHPKKISLDDEGNH